mgnify:CR=1 FL=1
MENLICLFGEFNLNFGSEKNEKNITFIHEFKIDLITGDIESFYEIINKKVTNEKMFRNTIIKKRNNFNRILDSIESGFIKGEKRKKVRPYRRCH